jgi:hypothetical protein
MRLEVAHGFRRAQRVEERQPSGDTESPHTLSRGKRASSTSSTS